MLSWTDSPKQLMLFVSIVIDTAGQAASKEEEEQLWDMTKHLPHTKDQEMSPSDAFEQREKEMQEQKGAQAKLECTQ